MVKYKTSLGLHFGLYSLSVIHQMAGISHDLLPGIALRNPYNTRNTHPYWIEVEIGGPPNQFLNESNCRYELVNTILWTVIPYKYTMPLNVGVCIRTMSIHLGCSEENKNRKSNRDHKGLCERCDVPWLFGFQHAGLISGYSNNLMASCQ